MLQLDAVWSRGFSAARTKDNQMCLVYTRFIVVVRHTNDEDRGSPWLWSGIPEYQQWHSGGIKGIHTRMGFDLRPYKHVSKTLKMAGREYEDFVACSSRSFFELKVCQQWALTWIPRDR